METDPKQAEASEDEDEFFDALDEEFDFEEEKAEELLLRQQSSTIARRETLKSIAEP